MTLDGRGRRPAEMVGGDGRRRGPGGEGGGKEGGGWDTCPGGEEWHKEEKGWGRGKEEVKECDKQGAGEPGQRVILLVPMSDGSR